MHLKVLTHRIFRIAQPKVPRRLVKKFRSTLPNVATIVNVARHRGPRPIGVHEHEFIYRTVDLAQDTIY
jgi:hypothetical protein